MRAAVLFMIAFLAGLNVYVTARFMGHWPFAAEHFFGTWLIAALFFGLQLVGPFADHLWFPHIQKNAQTRQRILLINWISYLALGILSCLFFYNFIVDMLGLVWILFATPDLILFNRIALTTVTVATLLTIIVGIWQANSGPVVKKIEIFLTNLPASFDGFKIVQISDLHVGSIIGRVYTQNVVEVANALNPDLIALTGDFVDGTLEDLTPEVAPLTALAAPFGKFFVTGNHEYYWGVGPWITEFTRLGAKVLLNEHVLIKRATDEIVLAGVTDYSTANLKWDHASSPKQALQGAPLDTTKILLAHQPASYKMAQEAGFDLQLSGHTHGGQYFPFSLIIGFFQRYYKGINRFKNMWIYVNTGTGYWGPPLRTCVPCEITLITLRSKVV